MDPIQIGLMGMGLLFVLILLHVPIGVAMGVSGLIGTGLIIGWDAALTLVSTEPTSAIANEGLGVVALFLLMGNLAFVGGLSGELYRLFQAFLGHRRGGLSLATIGSCAGFGAVCGSAVATTNSSGFTATQRILWRLAKAKDMTSVIFETLISSGSILHQSNLARSANQRDRRSPSRVLPVPD